MQPNHMSSGVYLGQSALLKAALVCALLTIVLLLLACAPTPQHQKLSPSEAKDHIDETATVCGDVVSTRYVASIQGQPTFLNLDKPCLIQIVTVLNLGESQQVRTPETGHQTKRLCVAGKIAEY